MQVMTWREADVASQAARGASDAGGTAGIAWTRVHAITDQSTCINRSRK